MVRKNLSNASFFELPEKDIGFHIERQQFPVQFALSMTINKLQG